LRKIRGKLRLLKPTQGGAVGGRTVPAGNVIPKGGRLNALKNTDSKPFLDFSQATWRLPWGLGDGNVRVDSPVLQTATSGPKAAKSR